MKTSVYIIVLLAGMLFIPKSLFAQFDPDKVCRIVDNRLVFTLDLKWSEKEKKEIINLFDLDSLLLTELFSGKTDIPPGDENWKAVKKGSHIVELSKPLEMKAGSNINDVLLVLDEWMKFGGEQAEAPVVYGINSFELVNAFVYTGQTAQFYLPGAKSARNVYLSGTFNNWSTTQTPMRFMGNGWIADVKLKPGKYAYKFIIDGRWTTDPSNRLKERGEAGSYNSVVYCHNHVFTLNGYQNAGNVVVTGNFFNWNPRGLPMTRTTTGWALPVFLREGTYAYKFLADGRWMIDPGNPNVRNDAHGNQNSFLEIGEPFIFRLDGFTEAKKVVLTGSFNRWNVTELVMQKTPSGWQLPYVVPAGNYEYKFIVDGKWMTDPANPFSTGSGDYENSFIALKANHIFELRQHQDAKTVIVTGSFNGWSTRDYRMIRQGGKWIMPVSLKPGKYTYKFIVDGKWITDPDNKLYEENEYGTGNSVLWIDPS
jgi:type 1 glutamine amidotransferase